MPRTNDSASRHAVPGQSRRRLQQPEDSPSTGDDKAPSAQLPAVQEDKKTYDVTPIGSPFASVNSFAVALRMATYLSNASLVPDIYRGQEGLPNALIALEISQRIGMSPLAVMQNMNVIDGRPSWSATFLIANINACGKFSPLRFDIKNEGKKKVAYEYWEGPKGQRQKKNGQLEIENKTCIAWAMEKATGERLESPVVSIEMAVAEGWYTRNGSKWKTMPDVMLRYRSASFFAKLYAPEIALGLPTQDEAQEITIDAEPEPLETPVIMRPENTVPITDSRHANSNPIDPGVDDGIDPDSADTAPAGDPFSDNGEA